MDSIPSPSLHIYLLGTFSTYPKLAHQGQSGWKSENGFWLVCLCHGKCQQGFQWKLLFPNSKEIDDSYQVEIHGLQTPHTLKRVLCGCFLNSLDKVRIYWMPSAVSRPLLVSITWTKKMKVQRNESSKKYQHCHQRCWYANVSAAILFVRMCVCVTL